MTETNRTVLKALELLHLFLTHPQLTLFEAVKISGQPKTSVYRMLLSLEEGGLLRRTSDGAFELGLGFLQYGQAVAERLDIRKVALPIMKKLNEEIGEAVNLIVRDGEEAIYVEKVDTKEPVRVYTAIGRRAPMYGGACPRVLLTFMPEKEQQEYLARVDLQPIANNTITELDVLRRVLEVDKKNGYTVSHSELFNYTSAVGAPIFDHMNRAIAGISIVGPTTRYADERIPLLAEKTMEAAREISRQLGWIEQRRGRGGSQ
ncbi:IclR family transcriptional regulator [Brevibacillus ruminantium]|uniref:IclR family transcriptional regulator n=1 Tax=Brevibacillus ruminantium TaxID=2950604 RepID=A0ABY4WM95_9BACL|nr:IclR family transcriptional regulator [Brevibacillus ruminantium]